MDGEGLGTQAQEPRIRVNSAYMAQNHGKKVCILGSVTKSDGGQAFSMKTTDGGQVNIRMKQPVNESLSGYVEVCGLGQGKNLVLGDSYITFPEEMAATFDPTAYNDMVTLINTVDAKDNPWKPSTF